MLSELRAPHRELDVAVRICRFSRRRSWASKQGETSSTR